MKINNLSILTLFAFLFFSTQLFSQNKVIDSLKTKLVKHIQKDTTRVLLLNNIAFANYGVNQDDLLKYAEEANVLAKEIDFTKGEARSLYMKGLFYLVKRDLENATISINQSLSLNKKIGRTVGISSCYNLFGTISRFQEDFKKSILYYNKVLQIEKDENNQLGVAAVLSNIGQIYNIQGEFDKSETTLKESIAIYDSLNEKTKILNSQCNLALVYNQQGKHTEALMYFQKCLTGYREQGNKIFGSAILLNLALVYSSIDENDKALPFLLESLDLSRELGNELSESKAIIGLGYVYRSKKEYNKALDYYNQALDICNKISSKGGLYNCYNNIGGLHLDKEEFDLALKNYKKGLEVSLALGNKSAIAGSYTELGVVYYKLGDHKKALENSLKGKELADELSQVITQKEANLYLSKLYEEKNNHKEALERFKDYKVYNDSLLNEESIRKIAELEYDYKYKQTIDAASTRELKLTKTVKATSQDLEKSQRNLLLGVIAFLAMVLILGGAIFFLKLKNVKSKTENILIEQKLLRSQMTPHFIFNSLSVLQGMILNKEDKKAVLYLSKFSKLLRVILENSRDKMVLLHQEITAVEDYLELQNLEESQAYQYTITVDDTIDPSLFKIPPMLIQPFIENAIEHAFKNKKEDRKIDVELTYSNGQLVCTIIDNGIGIDSIKIANNRDKKSLATKITSERLKMLSKNYECKGSITIKDRQNQNQKGTIVTLSIPHKIELA